ncbi:MAG: hypothetical protein NT030_08325, partial [Candidatus Saganbacteria bacterium]|nr:hypothetical protein [Candidatus Saganbacteria bacterium]
GMATTFGRTGIWSLMLFGATSMLMLRPMPYSLPAKHLLQWIIDLGITNYALIEAGIRFSNLREGIPWKGTTLNFAYEKIYVPFNYINVQKRLWSNESAGFNVTGALVVPSRTAVWGKESTPLYLRQNFDAMGVNSYVTYRIARQAIMDGVIKGDMMSLLGGTIALWPALDLYYTFLGMMYLNDGNESIEVDNQFLKGFNKEIKAKPIEKAYVYDSSGKPVTTEEVRKIEKGKDTGVRILSADGKPLTREYLEKKKGESLVLDFNGNNIPAKEMKKIASGRG